MNIGRRAVRQDGGSAAEDTAEREPLFSAHDHEEDVGVRERSETRDAPRQDGAHNGSKNYKQDDAMDAGAFPYPPPKYLKSTFKSREHEFEASDDFIEPGDESHSAQDVPVLTGLLQSARNRGSIDTHRRTSGGSTSDNPLSVEDAASEAGLIVGSGQGGSILASVSNSKLRIIIGAGIIGLPYAIREAGFVTGLVLLVGLGFITDWTIRMIVVNAKMTGKTSYSDIMEACFGYKGRAAVAFIQFAMAFGGMCAFAVILGDTIPHVLTSLMPTFADTTAGGYLLSRQVVTVVLSSVVSYPLSLYRDIDKLSKASALALVSMGVIILTVLIEGPSLPSDLKGSSTPFTFLESGFFEAVGVISFAYVCHHNTLLIYGSLMTPTLDRWNRVTHISMGISVASSLLMATSGYFIFTDKTRGNILNNFPSDHFWANIARLCFGLNMMTTTPLEAFVCREVFEGLFYQDQPFNQRRHVIVTTALILAATMVSLLTCDLGLVLELTGGFSATCLAYIFRRVINTDATLIVAADSTTTAAACSLQLTKDPFSRSKIGIWACMCFGIIVCLLATSLSIIKSSSKPHKVC